MQHGGDLSEAILRHGGAASEWLDLSTGINPWPYPVAAPPAAAWHGLPGRDDERALLDAARRAYRVPAAADIVAAPGAQSLIQWLPRLAEPGAVAIVSPTYGEHASCWSAGGRAVIAIDRLDALPAAARHAVVVNPNNPDGRIVAPATLQRAADDMQRRGGWLVVDESFADLDPRCAASALCADGPVIVLRSFGKFYGLAGLRLGFAIAAPAIAQSIAAALGPWAVSGPALAIGRAALADGDWAQAMRDRLHAQAGRLDAVLDAAGFSLRGGTALFRLAQRDDALACHQALAARRIWTRRFDGHPDWLRVGLPGDAAGLDRLAAALNDGHG